MLHFISFHGWGFMDQKKISEMIQKIIFHDLDHEISWSGSKKCQFFFDPDQKNVPFFLIRIKKLPLFFWSGSKKCPFIFDPDQKNAAFFLVWIKNVRRCFLSGSFFFYIIFHFSMQKKIDPDYFFLSCSKLIFFYSDSKGKNFKLSEKTNVKNKTVR